MIDRVLDAYPDTGVEVAKAMLHALVRRGSEHDLADAIVRQLDLTDWLDPIRAKARTVLGDMALAGAKDGLTKLTVMVPKWDPEGAGFALPTDRIERWAEQRAAELVGKRVLADGSVIDNPNPRWAITETTREAIRADITAAFREQWTPQELRDQLEQSYAFSESRAKMVADTEVGKALVAGNMESWRESGVVSGKEWVLGSEHDDDDECDDNAAAGVIAFDEVFPSGDAEAPAHPRCVCDVLPVVDDDAVAQLSAEAEDEGESDAE